MHGAIENFTVITAFAPAFDDEDNAKNSFCDNIQYVIEREITSDVLIVAEDRNTRPSPVKW